MMVKFSVNENKEYALRVLPNRQLVHESGRGEVSRFELGIFPMYHVNFFLFLFLIKL